MKLSAMKLIWICLLCLSTGASASNQPQIVPAHEHDMAKGQTFKGPSETRGIESVIQLGVVGLDKDFPSLKGKVLRARELTIAPGGMVAVHQHDSRPGVAYILEGEIIEHRNDHDKPIVRKIGAVAFEQSGVVHWWENTSKSRVRALVVDIVSGK